LKKKKKENKKIDAKDQEENFKKHKNAEEKNIFTTILAINN
jgi:hypothetical protein